MTDYIMDTTLYWYGVYYEDEECDHKWTPSGGRLRWCDNCEAKQFYDNKTGEWTDCESKN